MAEIRRSSAESFDGLVNIVSGLANLFPGALRADVLQNIRERLDKEVQDDARYTAELMRQRANGTEDEQKAKTAAQRLSSPRLVTTPRGERRRLIARRMLDSANDLATHLGPAIQAAVRLVLLEFELDQEDARDISVRDAQQFHSQSGVYKGVKDIADELFHRHGITHNDWKNVDEVLLDKIAEMLRAARQV